MATLIKTKENEPIVSNLNNQASKNSWFISTKNDSLLLNKVTNMIKVISQSESTGLAWFEVTLSKLFRENDASRLLSATQQIVDCIIAEIEKNKQSEQYITCIAMLHIFAKIWPKLLVNYLNNLQNYLQFSHDLQVINILAKTIAIIIPLKKYPNKQCLIQLEKIAIDFVTNVNCNVVICSCLSLIATINAITNNYKTIRDCFKQTNENIRKVIVSNDLKCDSTNPQQDIQKSLLIIGFLFRYFDFGNLQVAGDLSPKHISLAQENVFYFMKSEHLDLQSTALKVMGSICIHFNELMLGDDLKNFYNKILTTGGITIKCIVLNNIKDYLTEEKKKTESLAQLKCQNKSLKATEKSEWSSSIIQLYWEKIGQCYLHTNTLIRHAVSGIIKLITERTLLHPKLMIPYLICMCTERLTANEAFKELTLIELKYPGYINTQSLKGIILTYRLQKILQGDVIIRGFNKKSTEFPAVNKSLYTACRNSKHKRHALILDILKEFDECKSTDLSFMLYLADNMAHFPYVAQDEPLFVIYEINRIVAVTGTALLRSFHLIFFKKTDEDDIENEQIDVLNDDNYDKDSLLNKLPEDTSKLEDCLTKAQRCLLLLMLKQHLQYVYGLNEIKIVTYTPWSTMNNSITRKLNKTFNPMNIIKRIRSGNISSGPSNGHDNRQLIQQYLNFKKMMLTLDFYNEDSLEIDEEDKENIPGGENGERSKPLSARQKLERISSYHKSLEKAKKLKKKRTY